MTSPSYDPMKFGEVSLGEPDDAEKHVDSASKGDPLFESSDGSTEPTHSRPILGNAPPRSEKRRRNSLPPVAASAEPKSHRVASHREAEALTRPRQGSRSRLAKRERLPNRRDHLAYSEMPVPKHSGSRVVPMVVLLVGLGAAAYMSLVAHHYPMAIFLALISLVAAPLARLIFQGAIA